MKKLLEICKLCPRNCGINRINGEIGFCGATNNLKVARGSSWEVGSEDNYSKLDLSWPGMSADYLQKFAADDGVLPNVTFRTTRYKSWDEVINNNSQGFQVYQAFVRSGQAKENFNLSMIP